MPTFDLKPFGKDLLTRDQGARARKAIEAALSTRTNGERLVVDLGSVGAITPSFVDECLGRLLLHLGVDQFRASIELRTPDESTRRLVNSVLAHRSGELRSKRPVT